MSNDSGKSVVLQNEGARNLFPHPQKKKKKDSFFRSSLSSENDRDVRVRLTRMTLS